MKKLILCLLFPLSAFAVEQSSSIDFCYSALSVADVTGSCEENQRFVNAAQTCLNKLQQEEQRLGLTASAIAQKSKGGQQEKIQTSKKEYAFSVSALEQLQGITKIIDRQLVEYISFLVPTGDPSNEQNYTPQDPGAAFRSSPCYGKAEKSLNQIRKTLAEKQARYQASKQQAIHYQQSLGSKATSMESLVNTNATNTTQGQSVPSASGGETTDPNSGISKSSLEKH